MKRIRQFQVITATDSSQGTIEITGWHKAWDCAFNVMQTAMECRIFDSQQSNLPPVAKFSQHNLQVQREEVHEKNGPIRWQAEALCSHGREIYANYNLTDFAWEWVEGAERDLPFRRSYLERQAERYPSGSLALMLGFLAEARDLLRKP